MTAKQYLAQHHFETQPYINVITVATLLTDFAAIQTEEKKTRE